MTSPLAPKNLEDGFFVVAVPSKPYYNPVKLKKAGGSVKEKEFIRRIGGAEAAAHAAHQRSRASRGHFFFRIARLGSAGTCFSTAHSEPLPSFYRSRCAPPSARDFSAPCARPKSGRHRSRT